MPDEATIQFIAILVTIAGLLGWLLKVIINHFIKTDQEKTKYIETLVCQNQKNTEKFTDIVNHQRTQDREMQGRHIEAIKSLTGEMKNSIKVNESMLEFLKRK